MEKLESLAILQDVRGVKGGKEDDITEPIHFTAVARDSQDCYVFQKSIIMSYFTYFAFNISKHLKLD